MIAYLTAIATLVGVRALVTLGLNVQWGMAGLVNLGAVAFFAVGAYTSALLAVGGTPLLFAWPAAVGLAAAAGAGLAMVALRLREDYLAIVTLGFGEVLRLFLLNEAWLTRGANGVTAIPRPLHAQFTGHYDVFYLVLVLATVAVVYLALERVRRSPFGRLLRAIREDEIVAAVAGKPVFRCKVQAFALGAGVAGIAGILFAHYLAYVEPNMFLPQESLFVWLALILGGSGHHRRAGDGPVQIGHGDDPPVERQVLINVQLEPGDVVGQVHAVRIGGRRWRRVRRSRREGVGLDQELLLREVHHQHPILVRAAGDVMNLHRPRPIAHHPALTHGFHLGFSPRFGQEVRAQGGRRGERLRQERTIAFVGDHGDAHGGERTQTAGVIEVMVTRDHVADRLIRHQLTHRRDHRQGALVVQGSFHDDRVVLHLDGYAVVRAASQVPDAVGHLLRRHARVRLRRLPHCLRNLDVDARVGPDIGDGQLERGNAGGRRRDLHREFHTTEVLVVRVPDLDGEVTDHGIRDHRLDLLDELGVVEGRLHREATRHGERDRSPVDGGVVLHGCLDDPLRRGPELKLPLGERDGRRRDHVPDRVPGEVSADDLDLARRRGPAAPDFGATPLEVGLRGRSLKVDRACVALESELGSPLAGDGALARVEHGAGGDELERREVGRTQRAGRLLERRSWSLSVAHQRKSEQQGRH